MKTLQWWDETERRLGEKVDRKIRALVDLELIDSAPANAAHHYEVRPIPGYNSTVYRMSRVGDGTFSCSCQGYGARGKCAHQVALRIMLTERGEKLAGDLFS